jgi:hypothetical protein
MTGHVRELGISAELSAQIQQRLAEYLADDAPDPLGLRTIVAKFGALPLVLDMGGAEALRPDGEVITFAWDEPHEPAVVRDRRLRNIALYRGSLKYPELAPLVPVRPTNAVACTHCEELAAIRREVRDIVCYACGGLGWLPQ